MCTIAKGTILGVLTVTKGNILSLLNLNFTRRKSSSLMRTIAERLIRRFTTGTPPILTLIKLHDGWHF